MKYLSFWVAFFILICFQNCSNFSAGFGSYEKPPKTSNKYYTRNFKLTNSKLKIDRRYVDLENIGLHANNGNEYSSFVFFENGFVLHNMPPMMGEDYRPITSIKYSHISPAADVGSYIIKNDTIFWGTRPGYMRRKFMPYYSAIISDSGLHVISADSENINFFRLQ